MEWITTSTILESLADHSNRAAWERFVGRFRGPLVGFARHMGLSETDAEDAAQETLAVFADEYRNGRYDPTKGRLSRWLFGIAYRVGLARRRSVIRSAAMAANLPPETLDELPGEDGASRLWDEECEKAVLELCLQKVRQEV